MPRSKNERRTRPVRLHEDVVDLADSLAPIFGKSVPDFVSDELRPILQKLIEEGAKRLLDKRVKGKKTE